MKVYWDTSALVRFYRDKRIHDINGITRSHSLAELFSALTGRGIEIMTKDGTPKHKRFSLRLAAAVVNEISARLEFVDLTPAEVLLAIQNAAKVGAQGGRIHDLLHAMAAEKAKANELWTLDQNDFEGLGKTPVKQL
jgi:predicted nucleic acid-binding protein